MVLAEGVRYPTKLCHFSPSTIVCRFLASPSSESTAASQDPLAQHTQIEVKHTVIGEDDVSCPTHTFCVSADYLCNLQLEYAWLWWNSSFLPLRAVGGQQILNRVGEPGCVADRQPRSVIDRAPIWMQDQF